MFNNMPVLVILKAHIYLSVNETQNVQPLPAVQAYLTAVPLFGLNPSAEGSSDLVFLVQKYTSEKSACGINNGDITPCLFGFLTIP